MRISAFSGSKLSFLIFSSYGAKAECFISEQSGDASYCGAAAEQCFIWQGVLWSTPDGVWSGSASHEAKPLSVFICFADYAVTSRLHVFLPIGATGKISKKYLIIQSASDDCASYLRQQMLHCDSETGAASSEKAWIWSTAAPYEAALSCHEALLWCMKRSLYPSSSALRITPWQAGFMF